MTTDVRKALEAGCSMHISKPFERAAFYDMLRRFVHRTEASLTLHPAEPDTRNEHDDDPEMRTLIAEFVKGLPDKVRELNAPENTHDFSRMAALGHRLKGSSGMYGFPELSLAAKELEAAAKQQSDEDLHAALRSLEQIVAQITSQYATPRVQPAHAHP
jgi:HPt (histidine-containing phosphotransfer) domain-containing protein